jgi:methyl-accepting chemotaxis protein
VATNIQSVGGSAGSARDMAAQIAAASRELKEFSAQLSGSLGRFKV